MEMQARYASGLTPLILLAGLLLAGLAGCVNEPAPKTLAKIGDYEVTEERFVNAFRQFYAQTGQAVPVNDVTLKAVLDGELERFTIVTWAEDRGWDADEEAVRHRDRVTRQMYMDEYARLIAHEGVGADEDDLRELFRRYNTRVRASHLYAASREEAEGLHARLMAGERFEDLAREVFTNPHLRNNAGDLGYFTVDEMDPAFENVAFRLNPGEISPVVATTQGYSIIRVSDVVTRPIVTETEFAQRRQALYGYALQRNREMAVRRDLQNAAERTQINEALFPALFSTLVPNAEGIRLANAGADTLTVATLDGYTLNLGALRYEISLMEERQLADVKPGTFREIIEGITFRQRSIEMVRKHSGFDAEKTEQHITESFHTWLVGRFNEYVRETVTVPEAELERMYRTNEEFRKSPLLINVSELVTLSEADAKAALRELRSGASFNTVLAKYGTQGEALLYDGELGLRPIDSFGKFAMALKDVRPGELAGPLEYMPDRWLVYRCNERIEPGEQSFEQARAAMLEVRVADEAKKLKSAIIEETKHRHGADADYEKMKTVSITI